MYCTTWVTDIHGLQTVLPLSGQSLRPYATNKTVNSQPNVNKVLTTQGNSGQPARTETESTTERVDPQAGGYIDKRCGDGSVRSDWAATMSTPVSSVNRFAVLAGTTDDEDYPPLQSSFVTVQSRRAKRQRQKTPQHPVATIEPSQPPQPRRISVVGKSAASVGSKISAAKKIRKKAVFCIDNVNTCCEVDDISSFVTSLSIAVLTCFEVKPRRRRNESETSDRKAFRLCIHEDDREQLLDGSYWPDSVSISDWYFKPTTADEDKRRCIDYINYVNTASTSNSAAGASTSAGIGVKASSVRPDAHAQKVVNAGVYSVPMVIDHDDNDAYTDADDTIVVENTANDGCR